MEQITYSLAMAIGQDAGSRNMRAHERSAWNDEDYDLAVRTTARLLAELPVNAWIASRAEYLTA